MHGGAQLSPKPLPNGSHQRGMSEVFCFLKAGGPAQGAGG